MPFPSLPFPGQPVLFDGGLAMVAMIRADGLIVLHDGAIVRPSQIRAHFED